MKYIALTIGPIYKTLGSAKKPKELFSASYLFSYLMKEFIQRFREREFVVPYVEESLFENEADVGLFHDRFIFVSQEGDLSMLKESVIPEVVTETAEKLNLDSAYLTRYLQIHCDEYTVDNDKNPVVEIMSYLDTAELFVQTAPDGDPLLQKALKEKKNFLLEGKEMVDDLKQLAHNNYFAIIHADGDGMTNVIKEKENLERVSRVLFEYCMDSSAMVKNFGGQTIFAGGDDLLFFAPVISKKTQKTVFHLCEEIAQNFETKMEHKATLSFGVGITYIKYPLYEALEKSRELLFAKAKSGNKNNLAFEVVKHSGQTFGQVIPKSNKALYDTFLELTSNIKGGEDEKNFLHSLHHKIGAYSVVLAEVSKDEKRLKAFFDNYFNEEEHRQYEAFFSRIIAYILVLFEDETMGNDAKMELLYSTLKFVKFIQGDKQ